MNNVEHYRKLRGLSQVDLAEMVGSKQPHISRIEKGDDGVTIRLMNAIAAALGVKLADLFTDELAPAEAEMVEAFRQGSDQFRRMMTAIALEAKAPDRPSDQSSSATDQGSGF